MEVKSPLRWCRDKEKIGGEEWYAGDWGSKLLFKARSRALEVNGRNTEKQNQGCNSFGEEDIRTFSDIEFTEYREPRQELDREVAETIG